MQAAQRRGRERPWAFDLARHDDLERPRGHDRDRRLSEPEDLARPLRNAPMGLEQRQTREGNSPEGRHVDRALEIDDDLLPDHLEAARDLHVQHVPRTQAIVRARYRASYRSGRRGRGSTSRVPRWLGPRGSGRGLSGSQTGRQQGHHEEQAERPAEHTVLHSMAGTPVEINCIVSFRKEGRQGKCVGLQ